MLLQFSLCFGTTSSNFGKMEKAHRSIFLPIIIWFVFTIRFIRTVRTRRSDRRGTRWVGETTIVVIVHILIWLHQKLGATTRLSNCGFSCYALKTKMNCDCILILLCIEIFYFVTIFFSSSSCHCLLVPRTMMIHCHYFPLFQQSVRIKVEVAFLR